MENKIYGIDLGTTNSCLSVLENGRPRIIPVDETGIVPSVVSLDEGEIVVGRKALNRSLAFPELSCSSVKRLMGSDAKVSLGDKEYRPEEISALILGYLVSEAKRLEGREVKRAVITVPAYFSDAQRRATREAGALAGLEVERLVNEPTAAALFYDLISLSRTSPDGPQDKRYTLVYDLGGGTFDVSVLRLGEIIEVVASTGDTRLGGNDIDALIAGRLARQSLEGGGPDLGLYPAAMARLRFAAERAKIRLSELGSVMIEEGSIPVGQTGLFQSLSMELTRTDLEDMSAKIIARTMDLVSDALRESRLAPREIGRVIMVGGMTRMPVITEALSKVFGHAQMPAVDPDLSVAHGAAIQGGIITGENADQILVDVAAHTLSLECRLDEREQSVCVPIIPRNTSIPAKRSRVFYTIIPNQTVVELKIYQGESAHTLDNSLIGRKQLGLAPSEECCPVWVEYSYDLNGIIHVTAEQKGYGRKLELDIDSRSPGARIKEELFSGLDWDESPEEEDDEEFDFLYRDFDDEEEPESQEGPDKPAAGHRGVNLVIRRAEFILANAAADWPGRPGLGLALESYREALEGGLEESEIDRLEDELMNIIESWN
ncbi:MAG: Hsp70 family protein [Deltaproteobacteria bacterium]|nr:Hsp70 family protein [Deltaproteobacteria bacterium]